jgi:hypothetical protein
VSFIHFWWGAWTCNVTIQQLNSNFTPHFGILVTGYGEIEHPPGSGHWVSASGADLLLKGLSN